MEASATEQASSENIVKHLSGIYYPSLLSTGCSVLDAFLRGGYEQDVVTTLYGPAGAGKTTLCLLAALAVVRQGKKVLYVDTEGGFSPVRFQQLSSGDTLALSKIFILKPTTFLEQVKTVDSLKQLLSDQIGLVIIDTISMLYRIEMGRQSGEIKNVNAELGFQLGQLTEIARKQHIPVLITNQVYSDFDERERVKMVGGDLLKYGSKCLLELEKYKTLRKAKIIKHRFLPEGNEVIFRIIETGLEEVSE